MSQSAASRRLQNQFYGVAAADLKVTYQPRGKHVSEVLEEYKLSGPLRSLGSSQVVESHL